jgi:hypothetical protein
LILRHTPKEYLKLFTERILIYVLLFSVGLMFLEGIKRLFDQWVVCRLLAPLQTSWRMDVAIGIWIVSTLLSCWYLASSDHRLGNRLYAVMTVTMILLLMARLTHAYTFYSFSFMPVKYADVVFVAWAGATLVNISSWLERRLITAPAGDTFLLDAPIGNKEQDKFNRARFAADIAKKIHSQAAGSAPLAIGINGAWGSGKTSFMNLVHKELTGDKQIIIHFNPWTSASAQSIIPHFFETLSSRIAPFNSRLKTLIKKYGSSIADIPQDNIFKTAGPPP